MNAAYMIQRSLAGHALKVRFGSESKFDAHFRLLSHVIA